MTRRRRGFTLVEMMMVIGIIGALAALAGVGLSTMTRFGRVNGNAEALTRIMGNLRNRAMNERCRYVLQINGPTYNPPSNVRRSPATALVYRKGDCGSDNGFFEPALTGDRQDRLIAEYPLADGRFELVLPGAIYPPERLLNASLSVSWNRLGQRALALDVDADGLSAPLAFADPLTVVLRAAPGSDVSLPSRNILIPQAGRAMLP